MDFLAFLTKLTKRSSHASRVEECLSRRSEYQRRVVHSLPSLCEQGLSDLRGIRLLARACADERSGDTGALSEDSIRRESRALIAAAKRIGAFLERSDVPGSRYTIRSGESEVRVAQVEQRYYKIKNPFAKLHLKKHPVELVLFEHLVHNILFPDCRLDFLGVCEEVHEARLVFRQQAVRSDLRPDDSQIADEMALRGLLPEERYAFGNDLLFVTDIGQDSDNVLVDDDGRLRFIDPIIGFKQPLQKLLNTEIESDEQIENLVRAICLGELNVRGK